MSDRRGIVGTCGANKPRVGTRLKSHGMQNHTELNGLHGPLVSLDKDSGRWGVEVDGAKKTKAFKVADLSAVDPELPPSVTCNASVRAHLKSKRLCRYGHSWWRPFSHFQHVDELQRAQDLFESWSCLLSQLANERTSASLSNSLQRHEKICQIKDRLTSLLDRMDALGTQTTQSLDASVAPPCS